MKNKINIKKKILPAVLALLLFPAVSEAQETKPLTPEDCYQLARQHFPLAKQQDLITKSRDYSLANASKGYFPQTGIYGQATYQSDVTKIAVPIPNVTIPSPDKDQYKLYGELVQPLTDLLVIKTQKSLYEANAGIQLQSLEVELYKLRERINQLFFGILLADEQIAQTELLKKDIAAGIDKLNAAVNNGTAVKSNADELRAELLKAEQRKTELKSMRKAYGDMLALFINQPVDEKTKFVRPGNKAPSNTVSRPELNLFERQKKSFDFQDKLLTAKAAPRVSLFFQAGYGKPAFNIFSDEFDFYYIGGARLSWSLTTFYTLKNERKALGISRDQLDLQRETFLLNTNLALKQQDNEISRYSELVKNDREIIALRKSIREAATAQLENGTITATDYLLKVNAEDQARQNLTLHEMQQLLAEYNYQATSGN
ncbi:MAG: outer membrane efflux protein [Bacteroidetes bacterium]|nr:MAG: outer membrane efflux protein [Bacteroidota bacterium]